MALQRGGMDQPGEIRRYFQGLVFAIDTRTRNPDSNYYSDPLPIIPVMDFEKQQIVRIDELATGGVGDDVIAEAPRTGSVINHCAAAEYVPELLVGGPRKDLKPLGVVQPEGTSFSVHEESLVEWQKWRFRYFDGVLVNPEGFAERTPHGKFDQAGGIAVETRATRIVSVVNIGPGKTSLWGTVVNPGALAQNHQHIFCVRIDPAIDGSKNTVVQNESSPLRIDKSTNPMGNLYEVKDILSKSVGVDGCQENNRIFKNQSLDKNPISGRPVGDKINPPPAQMVLADPVISGRRVVPAGEYPLSSKHEVGGVADMVARDDDLVQEDVVLWSCFGLTHNPRVEDWPVVPVETLELHLTPIDFFTGNPAIDVPSGRDSMSKVTNGTCSMHKCPSYK
ncbi:Fc.00g025580.m01.CDS01 [Cosmosporella sp. VM-42]